MATFQKRSGAPAGTITITTSQGTFVIDDTTNTTFTVTDPVAIKNLQDNPYVQLIGGGGGSYTPPPVIQNVFLKDGVLVSSDGNAISTVTGPAGANYRGQWSFGSAYSPRDTVFWLGSSYVCLVAVAAGGASPSADVAAGSGNWMQLTSGGGLIASSVYSGPDITLVNNAGADIPGLVLSVPAGAPAYLLRAYGTAQINATAANGWGQATLIIQDVDNGNANVKQTTFAGAHPLSGGVARGSVIVEEPMPAPGATARNFKVQQFGVIGSATVKFVGPGTAATAPSIRIEAIAR